MGRDRVAGLSSFIKSLFQPTRPHGARLNGNDIGESYAEFQPTRPHGARHGNVVSDRQYHNVSTHAPAWGATIFFTWCNFVSRVSTHAPAWGATYLRLIVLTKHQMFQPTRPHGARPTEDLVTYDQSRCFNPRARMGRDGSKT